MAGRNGGTGRARAAFNGSARRQLYALKETLGRAGYLKLFILGLAIGMALGILGGRAAERFRLGDYVAIEQMILDRERPADPRPLAPPRLPSPAEPSRM